LNLKLFFLKKEGPFLTMLPDFFSLIMGILEWKMPYLSGEAETLLVREVLLELCPTLSLYELIWSSIVLL